MLKNQITIDIIKSGVIKVVHVLHPTNATWIKCTLVKLIEIDGDYVLKIKVGKQWPMMHKFIYRSIEEVQ